jgi:hypothetical protein
MTRIPTGDAEARSKARELAPESPGRRPLEAAVARSPQPVPGGERDPALEAAETLARWMDRRLLDPVLGMVLPGAGDLLSAGLGLYPLFLAWRRGAPRALLARMLLNLSVDLLGGSVPIVGDIWDFFFKAHSRNLDLLRARSAGREVVDSHRDRLVIIGAAALFLLALALPVVLVVLAVSALRR